MRSARWSPIPPGEPLLAGSFTAAAGYRTWRPHGTADWELLFTRSGRGHFAWSGGSLVSEVGSLVLLRPGTPHDYGTADGAKTWDNLWLHFHPRAGWDDLLDWPAVGPGHGLITDITRVERDLIEEIRVHDASPLPLARRLAATRLEELLLRLHQRVGGNAVAPMDPVVRLVVERCAAHLAHPPSRAALAKLTDLSPSRLSHRFRAAMGESLSGWLERTRLGRAAHLLDATDLPIAAVAAEVGYADPFHFSGRFRRWSGHAPTVWRRRCRDGVHTPLPDPPGHMVGITLPPHTGR